MRKVIILVSVLAIAASAIGGTKLRNAPWQWKPRSGWAINQSSPYVSGMIALYLLDEGGGTAYNSQVNNVLTRLTPNTGIVTTWGDAIFGRGVKTGPAGEMRAPNVSTSPFNDLPLSANGFTLIAWVRAPGNNVLFRKTTAGTNNAPGWLLQNNGAGAWVFRIQTSGAQCNGTTSAAFPITASFYQIAWRFSGGSAITASNYTIFMNGIPVTFSSTTNGTGTYNSDASNPLSLPVVQNTDHIAFWNRGLSNGEIRDLAIQPFAYMAPSPHFGIESIRGGSVRHRVREN